MKTLKRNWLILLIIFLTPIQSVQNQNVSSKSSSGLLYQWDFENNNPMHDLLEVNSNVTILKDPLDSMKNKVMCCFLPNGEYRTEASVGNPKIHYFYADSIDVNNGDEFWVGVRILKFKENYSGLNKSPSIFQIGPVQNPITYKGSTSAGHYQLLLNTQTDQWILREYNTQYNPNYTRDNISPVNYGKWENFVFHCKFRSNSTGLIEIWKNGKIIYSVTRPNGIKYDRTRIKWGVYIGAGNTAHEPLKCYFDDIKIGGAKSSYNEVAPE